MGGELSAPTWSAAGAVSGIGAATGSLSRGGGPSSRLDAEAAASDTGAALGAASGAEATASSTGAGGVVSETVLKAFGRVGRFI